MFTSNPLNTTHTGHTAEHNVIREEISKVQLPGCGNARSKCNEGAVFLEP